MATAPWLPSGCGPCFAGGDHPCSFRAAGAGTGLWCGRCDLVSGRARCGALRNGAGVLEVFEADIATLPLALRQRQFDHVLANPPYWRREASVAADNPVREAALGEQTPLALWVSVAARRLAPKGYLHIIHRAERLPDLMAALPHDMGSVEVLPVAAREGRAAERVILRARKSGRADFRLHAPLVLHRGMHHLDGDQYTPHVRAALRTGAALPF